MRPRTKTNEGLNSSIFKKLNVKDEVKRVHSPPKKSEFRALSAIKHEKVLNKIISKRCEAGLDKTVIADVSWLFCSVVHQFHNIGYKLK